MNLIWRERHPESAIIAKRGLATIWHQFRMGWGPWRVTTLFDVETKWLENGHTPIEIAKVCDDLIFQRRA